MAHIAIVDDEKNTLTSLRLAFEHEGYSVETYDDPLVALPKLIFVPPDLLILNGHMPGMHGIEFFQKFRQYSKAPVIFLSASADEIQDRLYDIGLPADEYVNKPCSQRQITGLVARVLRLHRKRANAGSPR